jgi:hypothetical protein
MTAATADPLAYVRDRELSDLIEALEAVIDLIVLLAVTDNKVAEGICATLNKTVNLLRELRETRP